jgi:hypothetical protein
MMLDILMENMRAMSVVTIRQRWNHSDMYVDDGSGTFTRVRCERDSGGGVAVTRSNIPLPAILTPDPTSNA